MRNPPTVPVPQGLRDMHKSQMCNEVYLRTTSMFPRLRVGLPNPPVSELVARRVSEERNARPTTVAELRMVID